MGDRDAVAGDDETADDLRPVAAVIAAVAVGERGEPPHVGGLEVARGEVVTDKAQIEVREVAQLRVQLGLGLVLRFGQGVDRPVAAIEARGIHSFWQCDRRQPLEDGAPLGARLEEPVGQHHKDRIGERRRAAPGADQVEVRLQAETAEVRVARGHGTEARPARAGQLTGLEPVPFCIGTKGIDDPVDLTRGTQLAHLAETQQRAMGILAVLAHHLDQRQVLVALVAPPTHRFLYEHTLILQPYNSSA